ncbi:hypothetical protein HPB50_028112 [Hyalomma asiaticum]|nr:hypothetical protein HPB50_028112 [Hyalomma asiaticum]
MASTSAQSSDISILTPCYMELLRRLCVMSRPSVDEVIAIFKGFRRSLDVRKPKPSSTLSTSSPTSLSASKKPVGKSGPASFFLIMASTSAQSLDISILTPCYMELLRRLCVMSRPSVDEVIAIFKGFRRSLDVRKPKPSSTLSTSSPTSLSASKKPVGKSAARTSAVVENAGGDGGAIVPGHVGFERSCTWEPDQKQCVTAIFLDLSVMVIERHIMWNALMTGAGGVKRLDYRQHHIDLRGIADQEDVGVFLDHLARNRSLKYLGVREIIVIALQGQALADVVQDHVSLEEIDVTGYEDESPSALLKAAVRSKALRSLVVRGCRIKAQDIEFMASALTISPLPTGINAKMAPPPLGSGLRKLAFENCVGCDLRLEAAYAKLIGGK